MWQKHQRCHSLYPSLFEHGQRICGMVSTTTLMVGSYDHVPQCIPKSKRLARLDKRLKCSQRNIDGLFLCAH